MMFVERMRAVLWGIVCALTICSGRGSNPNIIYVLLDDIGYSDISARGAEFETPNLDELYQDSIVLNSHYIGLLCSPSRSQILSGRYAWNMGLSSMTPFGSMQIESFPAGMPTIGNLLKQFTDYSTYVVGKWHVGYATDYHTPLYRGFDEFYGFLITGIWYSNKTADNPFVNGFYIDWWDNENIDFETQYTYSTFVTRDRIVQLINQHSAGGSKENEPFYIYAAFQAPHSTLQSVLSKDASNCDNIDNPTRKLYCQNVLAVDMAIGDIMTNLKSNDLWDNTIIVFTSDNGGEYNFGGCNYPLRGDKGTYYDGGVKSIAFVGGGYIDDTQKGTTRDGLMHGSDWTPTLLSIAGVKSRDMSDIRLDGVDLSQWLLYGDESDNSRTNVGLSINEFNTTQSVALVFVSNITGNTYKFMNVSGNTQGSWCNYCDYGENIVTNGNNGEDIQRCQTHSTTSKTTSFLFDLTSDYNETSNLMSNKNIVLKMNDLNEINGTNNSSPYHYKISKLSDYFKLSSEEAGKLVTRLWKEGIAVAKEYMSDTFFNQYTTCQNSFYSAGNPVYLDGAWKPFMDWDTYTTTFHQSCKDGMKSNLIHSYISTYDD